VFERFTENAKLVVVRGQTHVRRLRHPYIGSEHLMLGLATAPDSNALRILAALDVSPTRIVERIEEIIPPGGAEPGSHIPFTPRAKKVLELGFQQAEELGDGHIGTEHILLGMLVEGEGVAAQVLAAEGLRNRDDVLRVLPPAPRVDAEKREVATGEETG
jgi:ATP-dependent Clp protease ATP-binding subunit ClpC